MLHAYTTKILCKDEIQGPVLVGSETQRGQTARLRRRTSLARRKAWYSDLVKLPPPKKAIIGILRVQLLHIFGYGIRGQDQAGCPSLSPVGPVGVARYTHALRRMISRVLRDVQKAAMLVLAVMSIPSLRQETLEGLPCFSRHPRRQGQRGAALISACVSDMGLVIGLLVNGERVFFER